MRGPSHFGWAAIGGLLLSLSASPGAAQVEVAENIFVDLSASDFQGGDFAIWPNMADDPSVGDFTGIAGNPSAMADVINGTPAVTFLGGDHLVSDNEAPDGIVGINPTRSIEAWVYNPSIPSEETILSWGHRGGPCGTNMSFNYGNSTDFGAVGHWCSNAQDLPWGRVPAAGQWHHLAYTYDGNIARVYADGAETYSENMTQYAEGINTYTGKIALAAQFESIDAGTGNWIMSLPGSLSIGKVRIHDGVLTPEQIKTNYELEKDLFPITPIVPAFTDAPADDTVLKTSPRYMRQLVLDGYPIPVVEVVEPAGATVEQGGTFGLNLTFTFPLPDPPPASFVVTLKATSIAGEATATWTVTVLEPPQEIQIAETLLVDLDAADPSAGTDTWTNLAPSFVGNFQLYPGGAPSVKTLDTAPAVAFNLGTTNDAYVSDNDAPEGIVGVDRTASIEAWVYNPSIADEETILAWGHRGGGDGTNMAFNYGGNAAFGAVGHWGNPDIGWGTVPVAGRWHHLAYTYDGTTTRVYADGLQSNSEFLGSGVINTWPGKINIAAQYDADGVTPTWGLKGSMAIGKVRIHDGVLTPDQVMTNYTIEKDRFPPPAPVVPTTLSSIPVHRYSFTKDASDSIGGADGIAYGNVTFDGSQAVLNNLGTESSNATGKSPPAAAPGAYIDLPNGIISALGDKGSFEAWVTWGGPAATAWARIFDFGTSDAGEDWSSGGGTSPYLVVTPYSGAATLRFATSLTGNGAGAERIVDSTPLPVGVAKHVVAVWDFTEGASSLFVDGVLVGTGVADFSLSGIRDVNNWLGRSQYADPMFKGSFDEVRIYDYALTKGEVLGNFQAGPDVLNLPPAGAQVVRGLDKGTYAPGETVAVSLAITFQAGTTGISLTEVPPPHFTVVDGSISDGGTYDGTAIRWDLPDLAAAKTLAYSLTPPSCAIGGEFSSALFKAGATWGFVGGKTAVAFALPERSLGDWQLADLGGATGACRPTAGDSLLFQANGAEFKTNAQTDPCRFIYYPVNGNFEMVLRFDCADEDGGKGGAGIMVRNGVEEASAMAYMYLGPPSTAGSAGLLSAAVRRDADVNSTVLTLNSKDVPAFPAWIKVKRADPNLLFYKSTDGKSYSQVGTRVIGTGSSTKINLASQVLVGIAVSGGGASARFEMGAITGPQFPTSEPPPPPTGLQAAGGIRQVSLSWTAPAGGADSYLVYRGGSKIAEVTTGTTFTDPSLADGAQYCYAVSAKKNGAESDRTPERCATTVAPPAAPANLTATGGDKEVDLAWDAVSGDGITYVLVRVDPPKTIDVGAATTYADTGLDANRQYCYQVKAKKDVLESALSTPPACATTKAGPAFVFKRGDADANGAIELTDAITILSYMFLGGTAPPCMYAADADANGSIELTDAITILSYMFLGGTAMPDPGPKNCGPQPAGFPAPTWTQEGCSYTQQSCQAGG